MSWLTNLHSMLVMPTKKQIAQSPVSATHDPDPGQAYDEAIRCPERPRRRAERQPAPVTVEPPDHIGIVVTPTDITGLMNHLYKKHPLRVKRLASDLKWLDKQGRKYGVRVLR